MNIISIKRDGSLQRTHKRFQKVRTLPQLTSKAMMEWGLVLEKDTKNSLRASGAKSFTGTLQGKGIRYEQRPRGNIGKFLIRDYGVKLDSMSPHYVAIKASRTRLLAWAKQAKSSKINEYARKVESKELPSKSIFVKPKPFIWRGYSRARKKLPSILQKNANVIVS